MERAGRRRRLDGQTGSGPVQVARAGRDRGPIAPEGAVLQRLLLEAGGV